MWDWTTPAPRRTLYVDGEMNVQDVAERLRLLIDGGAVAGVDREALGENLSFISRQGQKPGTAFYDLADPETQAAIIERCERDGVEALVIDNLTTVADSLPDENDATAFRTVQAFLLAMKQQGVATILIHHARKDGTAPRGSSTLDTTFEVRMGLHPLEEGRGNRAAFTVRFEKFRAKGDRRIAPMEWTLGDGGSWQVKEDASDRAEAVVRALKSYRFVNQTEMAEHFGVSQGTISKWFHQAIARNLINSEQRGGYFKHAVAVRKAEDAPEEFDPALDAVASLEGPVGDLEF